MWESNRFLNNFAISSDGIAEGLQRSASTLVAAGNSLEQSIAMLAAGNKVAQDPEALGNALKVLSMRIRGTKTELEEAGEETDGLITNTSKLQAKVKALTNVNGNGGVDILTDTGAYRSTYDILLDIAEVWDDINDANPKNQAALLEILAGKTRGSQLAAILQNPEDLRDAYEMALESEGSALKELDTYLDSIQGKMQQFTNSVQTMWMNILDSEVVKWFVDRGTDLVNLADQLGVIRLLFIGLTTIFMRKSGITSLGEFFKAGAISAEEASKKLAELKARYAELDDSKSQKNLRQQDRIQRQMKPYQAIVDGAEKAKIAQDNLTKSQNKLQTAEANLANAQKNNYKPKKIKQYQEAVDQAKQEVAKCKEEVQKCEIANRNLGNSAAIGFGKLKAGSIALGKQLWSIGKQMLEMYAITALLDVLRWAGEGVVHFFDGMHETAEEAQERLDELKNELEAIESEIDSLNSELETTNDSIEELMDQGTLSFTEQEELDRLKAVSAELEKQIQFQQTLKEAKSKAVNAQAVKATSKYLNETSFYSDKSKTERQEEAKENGKMWGTAAGLAIGAILAVTGVVTGGATIAVAGALAAGGAIGGGLIGSSVAGNEYDSEQSVADAIANIKETREKFEADIQEAMVNGDAEAYNEATEALNNYDAKMADHMSVIAQNANSFDWETATEEQKREMQKQLNLLDAYNISMEGKDATKNALDRLFGEDADEVVKAYAHLAKTAVEAGESFSFTEADAETIGLDDDLGALGITTQQVTDYFTKLGEAGVEAADKIDFSDVVSELAKVEDALDSVKSVMEEFRTKGIVSASTLEGMKETYGALGDVWENYVEIMLSGTASMAEANAATEALAKAYLDDHINDINEDTKLTYIAQLEKFGVDNPKELVESYITNSFWNSNAFTNFKGEAQELIELAQKYGVVVDENKEKEISAVAEAKKNVHLTKNKYYEDLTNQKRIARDNKAKEERRDYLISKQEIDYYWVPYHEARVAGDQEKIEYYKKRLLEQLKWYGATWEELFPELEVEPDVVASKQKWEEAEKRFQELCDEMNLTVTPDIETADAINELARFESGMKSLSDAYQEYNKEGVVSFGTLSELGETFSNINTVQGVKDEYNELIKLMGTSGTSISAIETQMERLATAYLGTIEANKMLLASEEERQVVIDNLTNMGVKNAEEIVNAKLKAIAEVNEAYGIDVENYQNAEAAKLAAAISTVYGVEVANSGLVTTLANEYGIDLSNFVGTEAEKVRAAKDAAKEIAKAHRDAQIAELETSISDDLYEGIDPNDHNAMKQAQLLEQKWLRESKSERDAINAQYQKALAEIDGITVLDPNDYINKAFGGKDLDLDFNLGDDFWTGDNKDSKSDTEFDWIEHYFTKIENEIKEREADLQNVLSADTNSIDNKNTIIDGLIDAYERKIPLLKTAMNAYSNRAAALFNSFSDDIKAKIADGSIEKIDKNQYSEETIENIQNYFDYITKASDLEIELEGVKVTIADFSLQKFDNAATAFDNEIEEKFQSDQDVIEAEIGYLEELGNRVDPKLYEKLIGIQKEEQKVLENKKATLENILATEVAAGRVPIGSEQWYEMTNAINDVDEALIESKNDIESFQNSINEIYWDNFEKLIDQLEAVNSELSNLFDILSDDDKVVDEFGNWTDEGITSLGLLAQQMENAKDKANEYAKAIKDLEANRDAYSLDEYNEKMAELKDSYLSEIKNIEDTKDAMVDLNKVRVDAVKEAIDKEIEALEEKNEKLKEELDLEKEQYDFQKQVAEQEKSMADIQRRLNALAGDTSASAIAERRKLQAELAEAQQEMDDMWYEHSIEEQQKNLDESLENYKENKEDEKEALDKWLEDEEQVIKESFDLFNSNVDIVSSVLKAFEEEHGVNLTDAIVNPWKSGIDAMTAYRNELDKMKQEQDDAKESAEDAADGIIGSLDKPPVVTPPSGGDGSNTGTLTSPPINGATVTVKKSATNFSRDGGNGTKMQPCVPGSSFIVHDSDKDEVLIGTTGGYTGWVKLSDIEGYYKGTTGVKDDQWAFTDELGPELTLHAGPNGRLQYLTKGSGVVTADLTERLMEWGKLDPTKVLEQSRPAIGAPHITTNNFDIDLSFGSLVHVDHCDQNTLPDLQKMVRGEFDNMMKTLNQKIKRK
jgi:DNA repair exonuclease SbcCD ATPase subunit